MSDELEALSDFAAALAVEAGQLALADWRRPSRLDVRRKADSSLVTNADRAAEALVIARIAERYPSHRVIGEESAGAAVDTAGASLLDQAWTWVVDPIDGTSNYASGSPEWCVAIGLLARGVPVAGAVYFPARGDELVVAWGTTLRVVERAGAADRRDRALEFMPPADASNLVATYESAPRRYAFDSPLLPRITGCMVSNIVAAALGQVRAVLTSAFLWDVAAGLAIARTRGLALHALERGGAVERFTADTVTVEAGANRWRLRGQHVIARPEDVSMLRRAIRQLPRSGP